MNPFGGTAGSGRPAQKWVVLAVLLEIAPARVTRQTMTELNGKCVGHTTSRGHGQRSKTVLAARFAGLQL